MRFKDFWLHWLRGVLIYLQVGLSVFAAGCIGILPVCISLVLVEMFWKGPDWGAIQSSVIAWSLFGWVVLLSPGIMSQMTDDAEFAPPMETLKSRRKR
ncbi:MAG TPA: hypothetical protein VK515_08230 [Rhizomicrobium sp.]|nr:hypothetical protein [Rhizomicrobium sp.]